MPYINKAENIPVTYQVKRECATPSAVITNTVTYENYFLIKYIYCMYMQLLYLIVFIFNVFKSKCHRFY